jgi:undecaprenyl diphosphate synthase
MDGNRRFAVEQGLDALEGHRLGQEVFINCVRWVRDAKIPHAVFYAFSTENWRRTNEEVTHLLQLFSELLNRLDEQLEEEGVRVRMIGRRSDFTEDFQNRIKALEEKSKHHTNTTIWVALSYGGRTEIIDAVNKAIKRGELVDEEFFTSLLDSTELPEPDMIVRTSGERRLSNFLTWQSVYSELYFIDKHWPALTKADFEDILLQYAKRQRRHGV